MSNYMVSNTRYSENLAIEILKKLDIVAKPNNLNNITNVDLLAGDKNIRIDVQYSQDFSKYGDFRIDFVSAYSSGHKGTSFHNDTIFQNFEATNGFKVDKVGKYFQADYLDAVIILFYNNKLIQDYNMPDSILIINRDDLLCYLNKNIPNIKTNHKNGLGDKHGSAFIPINIEQLTQNTLCHYGSIIDLINKKTIIRQYLGC
ncbi:hypothetical protein [Campylobacter mucosalis]|uniref:hypothetical protein n=1 Tax=Campylobacter mucosalis TaxID=202 RepID=UPI00147013EA|nr:hypothetical protein [Campylobacter mucosalis]